jgi:hypothetical protein
LYTQHAISSQLQLLLQLEVHGSQAHHTSITPLVQQL